MMNEQLARQIEQMCKYDQEARFKSLTEGDFAKFTVYAVDAGNGHILHQIIRNYGYPTIELIGAEGMEKFWLLIQHQDMDVPLQRACLEHCDFSSDFKAMLTDRVRINEGKKQIYGTQFHRVDGVLVSQPIEDEVNVNERRKALGLDSVEDELRGMRERDEENKRIKNKKA